MLLKILALCFFALFITPWFFSCLTVTPYNVSSAKIPNSFDGFKIAVITDLHSHRFGKNQYKLVNLILEQNPDIVVLVGDIIDKYDEKITNVQALLEGISGRFPIYATAGNHEFQNPAQFNELIKAYNEYGVIFLDGQTELIEREDHSIAISSQRLINRDRRSYWANQNTEPLYKDKYNIFLYHFGNEFDRISDEYDLVISGHVHGGIIRIFNRGLIGYNRNIVFFPKYTKGLYRKESGSVMVLSAGLGYSAISRINNPREMVVITLGVSL